ncbi:MAG TPA: metallophosphoesterase [Candidatus Binatia bacterium]|jgi:predicted MPP superfamily phosphohydrolase|nr:metallophosphoesterase [Candidatus Binatia bacterium]
MMSVLEFPPASRSLTYRWLRVWQFGLNLFLLLAAVVLGTLVFRRGFFLLVLVPIAFVPFSYARLRFHIYLEQLLRASPQTAAVFFLLFGIGVLLDCVMVAQLLTARSGSDIALLYGAGISWVGAIWFSAHALLFLGYAFIGFARLSRRALSLALHYKRNRSEIFSPAPVSPERRQFLQQLGVLGAGAPFFFSLSGVKLSYDFRVEEREIVLPHWPQALDGLRVAHLSDIHVGSGMNRARLLRVVALTNAARPDLVVHTGDFLTHRSGDFDTPLYEALAQIKAPYGQWACLGNHDWDTPERLVRGLSQAGVTTLRNSLVTLSLNGQPLEIAGLDFLFAPLGTGGRHYADIVRSWGPRRSVPRLLLNHAPQAFSALPRGCADLVLSGHTHGGHVGVQLGRDHALTVVGLCGIPDQGLFRRGDMHLFVTRCVGFYGYPMRLGIPPEIALLTLRAPVNS